VSVHDLHYIVVLGADLTEDGTALGETSKARCLKAEREWMQYGNLSRVVVSAQYHPTLSMPKTMASLQAECLEGLPVLQEVAPTFDTRGELSALPLSETVGPERLIVVTSWWHKPRAKLIMRQLYGRRYANSVSYVTSGDNPSARQAVQEVLKHIHVRLPASWQKGARALYEKFFGNASY